MMRSYINDFVVTLSKHTLTVFAGLVLVPRTHRISKPFTSESDSIVVSSGSSTAREREERGPDMVNYGYSYLPDAATNSTSSSLVGSTFKFDGFDDAGPTAKPFDDCIADLLAK